MITTRARAAAPEGPGSPRAPGSPGGPGSPGRPGSPDGWTVSVIALDVLEQAGEVTGREALRRPLEPLHRPRPEVEVERARRVLDRAPQGPAVLPRQAEQPGPGRLAAQRLPVVGRDQFRQGVHRQ